MISYFALLKSCMPLGLFFVVVVVVVVSFCSLSPSLMS